MSQIKLTPQFVQTLDLLEKSNKHVFLTGKAGTGKSTLLNHFRATTSRAHVVLAPTGIAAVNVEGETIHSFFAFHPGINAVDARKEGQNRKDKRMYEQLEMIVIDEISMVRSDLVDSIDGFLKGVRGNNMPFGGVQMVFIGDVYQLPPVLTREEEEMFSMMYQSPYFFDSIVMHEILHTSLYEMFEFIELHEIFRQNDEKFIEILNKVRSNNVDFGVIKEINQRCIPNFTPLMEYIYLVGTNRQADEINKKKLDELKGSPLKFKAALTGNFDARSYPTEEDLVLKVGARVMFVKNDPEGRWINGTVGTVKEFVSKGIGTYVRVAIDNGNTVDVEPASWDNYKSTFNQETRSIEREITGSFTQIPLKLAWAFTIHKSQGKTFEKVILDLGNGAFAHGQTYVALSRCKSLDGLVLKKPLRSYDIKMDRRVDSFIKGLGHMQQRDQSE